MSRENVELVRFAFEEFAQGGVERMLAFFPEDGVMYPYPEWVEASEYRGEDGMRAITSVWTDNFDDYAIAPEEIRDLGDCVLVLGEQTGRIKGSGVPIRQPIGMVLSDFRDGKIGEGRFFLTWKQALEAAGLDE
jgi:ketosteroid isomerase-like protein